MGPITGRFFYNPYSATGKTWIPNPNVGGSHPLHDEERVNYQPEGDVQTTEALQTPDVKKVFEAWTTDCVHEEVIRPSKKDMIKGAHAAGYVAKEELKKWFFGFNKDPFFETFIRGSLKPDRTSSAHQMQFYLAQTIHKIALNKFGISKYLSKDESEFYSAMSERYRFVISCECNVKPHDSVQMKVGTSNEWRESAPFLPGTQPSEEEMARAADAAGYMTQWGVEEYFKLKNCQGFRSIIDTFLIPSPEIPPFGDTKFYDKTKILDIGLQQFQKLPTILSEEDISFMQRMQDFINSPIQMRLLDNFTFNIPNDNQATGSLPTVEAQTIFEKWTGNCLPRGGNPPSRDVMTQGAHASGYMTLEDLEESFIGLGRGWLFQTFIEENLRSDKISSAHQMQFYSAKRIHDIVCWQRGIRKCLPQNDEAFFRGIKRHYKLVSHLERVTVNNGIPVPIACDRVKEVSRRSLERQVFDMWRYGVVFPSDCQPSEEEMTKAADVAGYMTQEGVAKYFNLQDQANVGEIIKNRLKPSQIPPFKELIFFEKYRIFLIGLRLCTDNIKLLELSLEDLQFMNKIQNYITDLARKQSLLVQLHSS